MPVCIVLKMTVGLQLMCAHLYDDCDDCELDLFVRAFNVSGRHPFNVSGRHPFNVSGRHPFNVSGRHPFNVSGRHPFNVSGRHPVVRASHSEYACNTTPLARTPRQSGQGSSHR